MGHDGLRAWYDDEFTLTPGGGSTSESQDEEHALQGDDCDDGEDVWKGTQRVSNSWQPRNHWLQGPGRGKGGNSNVHQCALGPGRGGSPVARDEELNEMLCGKSHAVFPGNAAEPGSSGFPVTVKRDIRKCNDTQKLELDKSHFKQINPVVREKCRQLRERRSVLKDQREAAKNDAHPTSTSAGASHAVVPGNAVEPGSSGLPVTAERDVPL